MSTTMAGLHMRHRLLLVLLVCLALPLVGGCSSDPECFVVPFLPKCFDDDDEEEKPDNTATQASLPLASLPAPRYDAALAGERRHGAQETPAPRGSEGLARDS
jgi:hypothetical protein